MKRIQLSKNFYLDEFTRSQTAVRHGVRMDVGEGGVIHHNLRRLCILVLQPLRDALGPVQITSGYRPPRLNKLIGGSANSQHQYGLAADIVVAGHTPLAVSRWIADNLDQYDQVIHEFGRWVHVSVANPNKLPRKQPITAVKIHAKLMGKPKTVYVPGLHSMDEAKRKAT